MNAKKFFALILSLVLCVSAFPVCSFASEINPEPCIVETVYPSANVVVADIILTNAPYNADNTGNADCSGILQKAIDDLYENGGGTIFLPVGSYRLCSSINIKPFVTVNGDWQDPDKGNDYGTLIIADVESCESTSPALFNIGGSGGAVGLTVWYPNQSVDNIKPYPYTFYIDGLGANYMLHSIINCTMLNSYRGIGACVKDGEGVNNAHEMTTIENVKGTCLKEGICFYNCADVDTVKTLYISGKYWSEAGEKFNAPSLDKLNSYTKENLTAFLLGDLEWPEFCDIKADHCRYGIYFANGPRASFSGTFYNLELTDCVTGIYAEQGSIMERGKQWGYSIANSVIKADDEAIHDYTGAVLMLTNTKTKGKVRGKNIHRETASTDKYTLDYNFEYVKPASNLYVVEADKSGKTDASLAVQAKLDEAKATGGIVYMPAGLYRFDNPIFVPDKVELRGSGSVATRCQSGCSKGTLIISYYGYLDETPDAKPLINVEGDNAGVFAIRINHLKNSIKDNSGNYIPTSSAIKVTGDNCHVINCFAILSSVGIEFENCENSYVRRCVGCCIDNFIKLTNCDKVLIEGCLQNGNALPRNGYSSFDIPEFSNWLVESNLFEYAFIPVLRIHCDYLYVIDSKDVTVFNTFIYGGRRFLYEENSEMLLVNVGSDGQADNYNAYALDGGEITAIGTMHSSSYGFQPLCTYEVKNNAKLKMYDRISVDAEYNMYTRFENVKLSDIEIKDFWTFLLQPIYSLIEKTGLKKS